MNKNNPSELVESWSSAPGRCNVMVVAPSDAPFLAPLMALDEENREASGNTATVARHGSNRQEKPFEIIHVEKASDATKLLLRGHLAVVVVDGSPAEPGFVDFLVTGLNKATPPRFIMMMDGEPSLLDTQGGIRLIARDLPGFRVCEQVIRGAQDFEKGKADVFAVDLLRAVCYFPDQFWLRITGEAGTTADLCVSAGRAAYCESGNLAGDPAARHLFTWGASKFECREFPVFLRSNMDSRLGDLLQMPPGKEPAIPPKRDVPEFKPEGRNAPLRNVWQMPAASHEPAAVENSRPVSAGPRRMPPVNGSNPPPPAKLVTVFKAPDPPVEPLSEPDIEEPSDIPALAAFMQDARADSGPTGPEMDLADEPEEPFFDPAIPEPEIVVEEPPEMYLAETPVPGFDDEPTMPEFTINNSTPEMQEVELRSEVFASFAIIQMSRWVAETVYPPDAAFDWKGLEDLFLYASDGSDRNGLGKLRRVLVVGDDHTLVATQVRNVDRVLVARTRDRFFAQLEESELMRLSEAVAVTAQATSA
ncbi:MAG: hypothetical protein HY820_00365 [Acidobacteria bacterium]|nr:hypothetical protein [Acidobacteriota bacterium]